MDATLVQLAVLAPRQAAWLLPRYQPIVAVTVVLMLAALSDAVAGALVVRSTTGAATGTLFLLWHASVGLAGMLVAVAIASVLLPFGARMLGGDGSTEDLLWSLALSFAPWTLAAALALPLQFSPYSALLHAVVQLLLLAWSLWIQVLALGTLFGLSTLRALFATMLGYGVGAVLFVAAAGLGFLSTVNAVALWAG